IKAVQTLISVPKIVLCRKSYCRQHPHPDHHLLSLDSKLMFSMLDNRPDSPVSFLHSGIRMHDSSPFLYGSIAFLQTGTPNMSNLFGNLYTQASSFTPFPLFGFSETILSSVCFPRSKSDN